MNVERFSNLCVRLQNSFLLLSFRHLAFYKSNSVEFKSNIYSIEWNENGEKVEFLLLLLHLSFSSLSPFSISSNISQRWLDIVKLSLKSMLKYETNEWASTQNTLISLKWIFCFINVRKYFLHRINNKFTVNRRQKRDTKRISNWLL